jgi:hypothetical protein
MKAFLGEDTSGPTLVRGHGTVIIALGAVNVV